MHPTLWTFDYGGRSIAIPSYGAAIGVAALVFLLGGSWVAARRGLPRARVLLCLMAIVIAAVVGSRLLHWALHRDFYQEQPGLLLNVGLGQFALQGGLVASLAVGLLGCRFLRIDAWRLADAVAPAIGLSIAVIRTGCFFNGCCFGKETNLPCAVTFPSGSLAHLHQAGGSLELFFQPARPVHPTQLYEIVAALLAAAIAVAVYRASRVTGVAFLTAAVWLATFQWMNGCLRAEVGLPSSLNGAYPAFHIAFVLAGSGLLWWRLRRR